ncbi:regulatory signaling modulator protein AmpE [Gallaecimonas kandeliae]|uniref:regulatory signaling modulator protein AmpE n=1 Tax=Gallaecimonas kandeliae TaxID=3029055 RepID=UPI0026478485|nr:regulatory signaling modulator protein AmpE [Gallaecimonas kandeliae]WKE66109.1 regulatory signaling modulator protein AmpE [Gallaecimonas kandeliae]
MMLLTLLVLLALDRVTMLSPAWQLDNLLAKLPPQVQRPAFAWPVLLAMLIALALVLDAILLALPGILAWPIGVLLLWVCLDSTEIRQQYRRMLNAFTRGDLEAADICSECLEQPLTSAQYSGRERTLMALLWANYRHYCAVLFFYVVGGVGPALAYGLLRYWHEQEVAEARKLIKLVDWLPVRFTALGFAFVGHYSRAMPKYLEGLLRHPNDNEDYLGEVAMAAEEVDCSDPCSEKPSLYMVALAKRNLLFFLALVAALILFGLLV